MRGEDVRTRGGALPGPLNREMHLGPIWSALTRRRITLILAFGVVFRVAQYLANRPLWMDEGFLAANIGPRDWSELFGPLSHAQLAPAGFLAVEWLAVRALGDNAWALRLFPLLGGVASLFLFRCVAGRLLRPRAVWIALGLFAVADDLIAYAAEAKPYAADVAAGLACSLLGVAVVSRPVTARCLASCAVVGATALWFSFPAAFVLAGVGTVLLVSALLRRDWRRALLLCIPVLLWAASFAAVYAVAVHQLGQRRDLWAFWASAFPPLPPASLWEATWSVRRLLYLFVNPLNFETPLGPRLSALPALGLCLAGCVSLWMRDRARFGMLALPGFLALAAAHLHLYPFHGRLVLFLVPALLLLIAEGAEWFREAIGGGVSWAVVLAALLLFPSLGAFYHVLEPRARIFYNPYGDRRPASLDPDRFPF